MALIGKLLKKGIKLRESLEQEYGSPFDLQKNELKKLLISAHRTQFGEAHQFKRILQAMRSTDRMNFYQAFSKEIPTFNYDKLNKDWWYKTREGESNVCWPGEVKYFALSSGTSGASSKYIPVTKEMLRAMQKTSVRQILSLSRFDLPDKLFTKGVLMLGGSTNLNYHDGYYSGDLSGITTGNIPFWFQHFFKPGQKIAKEKDWSAKIEEITVNAHLWDIGFVAGVPAWMQILFENIIEHYGVDTIHDVWPNFSVFTHGGVSLEPYKQQFEKLLARPITYIETYLASEGFIAFQAYPDRQAMKLVLNNGIFYEFVPFNDRNFDSEGELRPGHEALLIDQVKPDTDYAPLLSTCAGAWRYLIGDTIRFINVQDPEIVISGRTKHFLSLCGEHLSVDNMNKAISRAALNFSIDIPEFTVAGFPCDSLFRHQWYIGVKGSINAESLVAFIDQALMELNDDYRTERKHALKRVDVEVLDADIFIDWLRRHNKEGGQNKFPRVLKGEKLEDWMRFLETVKA